MYQSMAANEAATEYSSLMGQFDWMGSGDAKVSARLEKIEMALQRHPVNTPLVYIKRGSGEICAVRTVGEQLAEVQRHRQRTEKRLLDALGGRVADLRRALITASESDSSRSGD